MNAVIVAHLTVNATTKVATVCAMEPAVYLATQARLASVTMIAQDLYLAFLTHV
jgi:hypothetical protein